MRVLVVGNGAREHTLAWCAARSPQVAAVVTAPGNAGTAGVGRNVAVDPLDLPGLVAVARRERIDLAIVGSDDPLAAGAVDALEGAGIPASGPTRGAAEIEWSKAWSKAFMGRHGIPTAPFEVFESAADAHAFLDRRPWQGRVVVKADGLARGKGVVVPETLAAAHQAVATMLEAGRFGAAGRRIVVEQRLEGPEASVFALCDGETAIPFGAARDHKRLADGDRGPNTGGMGAYTPTGLVPPEVLDDVLRRVIRPAVAGMAAEGRPFAGFLYAGLLFSPAGLQVLEFNARFGDPEAQAVLPLLESDLIELLLQAREGRLAGAQPRWRAGAGCAVCLASAGYPDTVRDGLPVRGLESVAGDALVFHAGTERQGAPEAARQGGPGTGVAETVLTRGGRILTVTGLGDDLAAARRAAYAAVEQIEFEGMQFRRDIGAGEAAGQARRGEP